MTYNKVDNDINVLKSQTLDIMNRLKIPIRKNYLKDDSLILTVYKSNFITCNYGQESIFPYLKSKKSIDTINRIYKKPSIALASILNDIMINKIDTSKNVKIKALGSVLHELTHYYQLSYISDEDYKTISLENRKEYYLQVTELEAHAVDAYYYLYFYSKKLLQSILKKQLPKENLYKQLINKQLEIQYPNDHFRL